MALKQRLSVYLDAEKGAARFEGARGEIDRQGGDHLLLDRGRRWPLGGGAGAKARPPDALGRSGGGVKVFSRRWRGGRSEQRN
jgi:hypothetical protein